LGLPKRPAIEARGARDSGRKDDLDNSVLELGDLLVHQGPALRAQQAAATIFGAAFVSMQRS
jgi:Orn/Lys/Arg decarboxylase, major domain